MAIEHPEQKDNPLLVVRFKDADVNFYATRLTNFLELRHKIDTGNYPLNWWKGSQQTEDGCTIELTPVNIRPCEGAINLLTNHPQLGLRWLVVDEIDLTASWLREHNCSNFADAALKWDKERQETEKK